MHYNEITIQLREITIAAKQYGNKEGIPTLAVHGWLDNANSFDLIADKLDRLNLVVIDLPGHGKSSHYENHNYFHFVDYILDLIEITRVLKWEKFNLLGHSLGAALCSILAGTYPEIVNKLALIDGIGPIHFEAIDGPMQLRAATEKVLSNTSNIPHYSNIEEAAVARANSKISKLPIECARILVERGLKKIGSEFTWNNDPKLMHASANKSTEEQVLPFLKNITCSTLLLLPEEGYNFGNDITKKRISCVENIEVIKLQGGHHVHMEHPEVVVNHLEKFFYGNNTSKR